MQRQSDAGVYRCCSRLPGACMPECTGGAVLDCPEPARARQAQIEIEEWTAIGTCRGEIAEHIADDRKLPWFVAHRTDGRHCT